MCMPIVAWFVGIVAHYCCCVFALASPTGSEKNVSTNGTSRVPLYVPIEGLSNFTHDEAHFCNFLSTNKGFVCARL